ncbi:MAG: DnaJ domain-containing protein, partial [Desulfobacterales bacterium]|nr:DnaJ domain-containing protein [Desulfobacterales bacterium]
MRSYYKILGLKKSASMEEIRERWVELIRKFHPDQRGGREVKNQRIQENNEAYQVLKHSSTRAEYDLRRMVHRKKSFAFPRKVASLVSIFIFLLAIGFLYFTEPHLPPTSKIIHPPQIQEKNSTGQENIKNTMILGNTAKTFKLINQAKPIKPADRGDQIVNDRMTPIINNPIHRSSGAPEPQEDREFAVSMAPLPVAPSIDQIRRPDDSEIKSKDEIKKNLTNPITPVNPTTPTNPINPYEPQIVQATPSSLSTIEEEVKRFFALYIERYTQKDLEGFLSLFSAKALQNQKDGIRRIREVYASFFNVSQEIRYRIEDLKIEVYQNAVEIKARYEIDQI